MRLRLLALVLVCAGLPAAAGAAEPAALARARALYNEANFDAAIAAAGPVRQQPLWADAAALIIARSHLERYRQAGDQADLIAAREMLSVVRPAVLSPRDHVDLLIGLGQALYLGEEFGAAAEIFDNALGRASIMTVRERLLVLEWWAMALDREGQSRPPDRRPAVFARLAARMEEELRQDPGNRVANYWMAAATRGAGDVDRAWNAAIAAWVRSRMSPDADSLRADLDRLVTTALVEERSRQRPAREQADAQSALRAEWESVKQEWK